MNIDVVTATEGVAGVVTAIGGAYTAVKTILASSRRKKEAHKQEILKQANEEMDRIRIELESKIRNIQVELDSQKENVSKDFSFLRQTYANEIKGLADKIGDIRDQLNQQHSQLVALLTRMIDNR